MRKDDKIYVAGHTGLVGSALMGRLKKDGFTNLLTKTLSELNLTDQQAVSTFFEGEKPEYVFLSAGKVGGIIANNTYPAEFIYENLMIQCNVIHSAWKANVKKLLFLGCACMYPRDCAQPMKEEYLLSAPIEPTNESYSIAKIAGLKMCQSYNRQYKTNFISCITTNLFGPNESFDLQTSHVIPALIRKFHEAKVKKELYVTIWGTGKPIREFMYVDDIVDACIFLMENYNDSEFINIGTGVEISISELAGLIREVVGFKGDIKFDVSKPDGTPRKSLDSTRLNSLGWRSKVDLKTGIKNTYHWYLQYLNRLRK